LFHWKSTPLLPSTGGAPLLRRVPIVVLLALLTVSLLGPVQSGWVESELSADPPVADTTAPSDRYFPETGFSVTDAAIWSYFSTRGGVATFGNPISRLFTFRDYQVQLFERHAIAKLTPQNAGILGLLELVPYSPIDGYSIPPVDQALVTSLPAAERDDYPSRAASFIEANVPNTWDGMNVGFRTLYTASLPAALNDGVPNGQLLAAVAVWGFPMSAVVADPARSGVAYQRFQRGVMLYDDNTSSRRFLPLGGYFQRVLAGSPFPEDLAAQAQTSPLWAQYKPLQTKWLSRPAQLPGTDLTEAFHPTNDASTASAPVLNPRAKSPEYGMNIFVWGQPATTDRDLAKLTDMGFGWQKTLFQWRMLEPRKGVFNWAEAERVVQASNAAGVKIIARVDFQPDWARADGAHNGPPDRYEDYANFVYALVDHFKPGSPNGTIHAIEIWNEPNISREWGEATIDAKSAADYVRLLCLGHNAAKRASPDIVTITAGLSPTGTTDGTAADDTLYLQWMYDARARSCFEVLGAHGAGYKAPPSISPQELATNKLWGGHASFGFRRVEEHRAIMVRNGDAQKQIWLLEFGWTSDPVHEGYAWHRVTEDQKAEYIVDAFRWAYDNWQPWIGVMTLWNLPAPDWNSNREEYWWSIANPDGSNRASYDSLLTARANGYLP